MLSIGALARATAISVETLRTWERRYGYPVPQRKPSGHRLYPVRSVPRLRRIAQALAAGHRASEVVPASDADLRALLETAPPYAVRRPPRTPSGSLTADLLAAVRAFDGETLTRRLLAEWARLGPLEFLVACLAPVGEAVGEAWEEGTLEVRFLSERVGDLLRSLRLPFDERAAGPLVVLSSLPGESRALGIHMAALVLVTTRCRVLVLGTEVPPPQLAELARDLRARAVCLSISAATEGPATTRRLRALRSLLPRRTALLVGGSGAPEGLPGVTTLRDLLQLEAWAHQASRSS
jgi:MerR family transcriptional regulator, light-induced transcriptional regulator